MATLANLEARPPPQVSFVETRFDADSFFGRVRALFADKVVKTQLERLQESGAYDSFNLQWHPSYDVKRSKNGCSAPGGSPPGFIWASDIGKWIEAVCYFLADPDTAASPHASEYRQAVGKLVNEMARAQEPDGYLNAYFQVADRDGMLKNLRDLCEGYSSGHLIEAALAHHHLTGKRDFLDVMVKNLDCFIANFGHGPGQRAGYPGHPELELAALRLYRVTRAPRHLAFAQYLVAERGQRRDTLGGLVYLDWEADARGDRRHPTWISDLGNHSYSQSHRPLHEQAVVVGHSVQAFYLLTAAADGLALDDARRLFRDAIDTKQYVTGGFGSDPAIEGFHDQPFFLPPSTAEGGCYAETCASVSAMMVAERLLAAGLDAGYRDTLERCLYNNVLGGASLDAESFYYWNKLATSLGESNERSRWYEVCCCPPNLARTVGMLGGYIWTAIEDALGATLNVHIYTSAARNVPLGSGGSATVRMQTDMPWRGGATITVDAPEGARVLVRVPKPAWARGFAVSRGQTLAHTDLGNGYVEIAVGSASIDIRFSLVPLLAAPDHRVHQDVLTVCRGPVVYCVEDVDNDSLDAEHAHFDGVGIAENASFTELELVVEGVPVVALHTPDVYVLPKPDGLYRYVNGTARDWQRYGKGVVLVPFFVRANRGGRGHHRTSLLRV